MAASDPGPEPDRGSITSPVVGRPGRPLTARRDVPAPPPPRVTLDPPLPAGGPPRPAGDPRRSGGDPPPRGVGGNDATVLPGDGPRAPTWKQPSAIGPPAAISADARPLIYRVLPRSAIGISVAILCFALGASLSGVILYSYYAYRLTQNEDRVNALTSVIPLQTKKATDALKAQQADAQNLINQQIAPLKSVLATGKTVQDLEAKALPGLYFVHTLDANGQPAVGTAFAVASDSRQTLLLASYTTVQAATRKPGPQVFLRRGGNDVPATVYTWDEAKDLALLTLPAASQPTLAFATTPPRTGERVFALSGLGATGAAITQGFVADVSADGIQNDANAGPQFQGGPLLNSEGQVVGILSRTYSPLGFTVADVLFAVPPAAACAKVLVCPSGVPVRTSTSGAAGGP